MSAYRIVGKQLQRAVLAGASLALLLTLSFDTQACQNQEEIWVGWLETKAQNLRLVINLSSSKTANPSGTIHSPDQSATPLPITKATIDAQRQVSFQVNPEGIGSAAYSFQGKFTQDALIGEIEQGGAKLPIQFTKAESLPNETKDLLGADSAWVGALDVGTRKVPLRFRIYSSAPYATNTKPRILLDSLAENANGFPASVSLSDSGMIEFSIPAIPGNAKYIAKLSEDKKILSGKFQQGFLPLQLDMQRVGELGKKDPTQDAMVRVLGSLANAEKTLEVAQAPQPQPVLMPKKPTESPRASNPYGLQPNGLQEQDFVVDRFDTRKPLLNESGKRADNSFKLAGTITFPKGFDPKLQYPAVVFVTGSGPQDRDETIGKHKPFREIANYLASQGMVVLRYDDRGVGQSSGEFIKATSLDFADDAMAVWQFARQIEGVDRSRVGLLGHSEGGIIGPMVAAWQREVGFLILIAPPVLPGSEILSSQIDRIAELEGVGQEDRAAAKALQIELQQIALRFPSDDESALSEVRRAIVQRWDTLGRLSQSVAAADEGARKKIVIDAITAQFKGLQSPWMRQFLAYDPSSNWVLFDCPVLAVWAEKDTQVLYEPNLKKLESIVTHNMNLKADMVVLSGLNHLLQRADTGLPDEYDKIDQTIDPIALDTFGNWLKKREILP
ncbi:MAG: alpha/beta fold hydrolase [Planctomycetaceae bacterium]|jgi:pimeloyl-ACP methyl ester carboxylesterase|nr:alpha/beta fold hydrolase [Planctomycetaceae bacterium]